MSEENTKTHVIQQADLDANPILTTLGGTVGDVVTVSVADNDDASKDDDTNASDPVAGDACTMPDGTTAGTMQDDGTGTGTLVCTVAPANRGDSR